MAETKQPAESGKKKSKLPILIAIVVLLLAAGGGAAYYFLVVKKPETPAQAAKEAAEKKKDEKPTFVEFENFTVNLVDPDKYLQIKLTFQTKSVDAGEYLKDYVPVVRNAVIPVLSSQTEATLMTDAGKTKLEQTLVTAVNKALAGGKIDNPVSGVLIVHMIIQ